jgi:hypothetical protein
VRLLFSIVLIFVALSERAAACTCNGISSISEAMSRAEAVVVVRIRGRAPADYNLNPLNPEPVIAEVIKSIKGNVQGEIYVSTLIMCYRSFDLEDFKPGKTYVFPLHHYDPTRPDGIPDFYSPPTDSDMKTPIERLYLLPSCSHSALVLSDGKLYTREPTFGDGERFSYYQSLTSLELSMQLGIANVETVMVIAAFILAALAFAIGVRKVLLSRKAADKPAENTREE